MGEQLSPDQFDQKAPPHHDYVQLPSGVVLQELPAIYLTERDWYARRSSSPLDSGKNKSVIGLALVNKVINAEAIPSATQFFMRAYKISHFPIL